MTSGARRCLNHLRTYGKTAFPFQRTIARKLQCEVRTVKRYIQELRIEGFVEVFRRGSTSAVYVLTNQAFTNKNVPLKNSTESLEKYVENRRKSNENGPFPVPFDVPLPGSVFISEGSGLVPEQTVAERSDDEISPSEKPKPAEQRAASGQDGAVLGPSNVNGVRSCPLAERASESISGEVATGSLPPPTQRKRPQAQSRDPVSWNAAVASLASRKSMERGFG